MSEVFTELEEIFASKNFENSRRFNPGQYRTQPLQELLAELGQPQNNFKSIHVAGTVAKGSTCFYLAEFLKTHNYKTAAYFSPHLTAFHERVQINGQPINEGALAAASEKLKALLPKYEISFFDALTALAFICFAEAQVEWAVIETGLGGRLDSTNVIYPQICVITPIGLDHQGILGDTITAIAKEKAGIIKATVPVYSFKQNSEALMVLQAEAKAQGSPLKIAQVDTKSDYLMHNYAVSRWIFEDFFDKAAPAREAVAAPPGRLEVLQREPLVVFDSAHNVVATTALADWLQQNHTGKPWSLLFAVMKERSLDELLEPFEQLRNKVNFDLTLLETGDMIFHNSKSYANVLDIAKLSDIIHGDGCYLIFGSMRIYQKVRLLLNKNST